MVTFFELSSFVQITLIVALGLPTPVTFWPVLASLVTLGKNSSTTLSGTTRLRESTESDVRDSWHPEILSVRKPFQVIVRIQPVHCGERFRDSSTPLGMTSATWWHAQPCER